MRYLSWRLPGRSTSSRVCATFPPTSFSPRFQALTLVSNSSVVAGSEKDHRVKLSADSLADQIVGPLEFNLSLLEIKLKVSRLPLGL